MSETARAKYQPEGAPGEFRSSLPENPRKEYKDPSARPPGKSGGMRADTPHRVSSSIRRTRARSRRRG